MKYVYTIEEYIPYNTNSFEVFSSALKAAQYILKFYQDLNIDDGNNIHNGSSLSVVTEEELMKHIIHFDGLKICDKRMIVYVDKVEVR